MKGNGNPLRQQRSLRPQPAALGRQPFGGFNMSGVGSKTGGPDYLLQFMDPRCVTENTIRRGFTPIAEDDDWV